MAHLPLPEEQPGVVKPEVTWGRTLPDIDPRYTLNKKIGRGTYGVVSRYTDTSTKTTVVIKRMKVEDKGHAIIEANILRVMKHANIIHIHDFFRTGTHLYLVIEPMEIDLHRAMPSNHITIAHTQYFMRQLLNGVAHMHAHGIVHRDLKPSNLLINSGCNLKICDFGMADYTRDDTLITDEEYVTRWYRAPELLLRAPNHSSAVDIWSIGCILGELLSMQPTGLERAAYAVLFAGKDELDQLATIFKQMGTPTVGVWPDLKDTSRYRWLIEQPQRPSRPWSMCFAEQVDPLALNLLSQLLVYDPGQRITARDALNHAFFKTKYN